MQPTVSLVLRYCTSPWRNSTKTIWPRLVTVSQLATFLQLSTVLAGRLLSTLTNEKTEVLQPLPHLPPHTHQLPLHSSHSLVTCWVPATLTFLFLEHSKIIPASRPGSLPLECPSPSLHMLAPLPHSGLSAHATFSKSLCCAPSIKYPSSLRWKRWHSKLDHPSSEGEWGNYFLSSFKFDKIKSE